MPEMRDGRKFYTWSAFTSRTPVDVRVVFPAPGTFTQELWTRDAGNAVATAASVLVVVVFGCRWFARLEIENKFFFHSLPMDNALAIQFCFLHFSRRANQFLNESEIWKEKRLLQTFRFSFQVDHNVRRKPTIFLTQGEIFLCGLPPFSTSCPTEIRFQEKNTHCYAIIHGTLHSRLVALANFASRFISCPGCSIWTCQITQDGRTPIICRPRQRHEVLKWVNEKTYSAFEHGTLHSRLIALALATSCLISGPRLSLWTCQTTHHLRTPVIWSKYTCILFYSDGLLLK